MNYRFAYTTCIILLIFPNFNFGQGKYLSLKTGAAFSSVKENLNGEFGWLNHSISGEDGAKKFNHIGINLAMDYSVDFNKRFGAGVGLGYVRLGVKAVFNVFNSSHQLKRVHNFDYFTFPIFFKILFDKPFKGYLYFGYSFDLLVKHETFSKTLDSNFAPLPGVSRIDNFVRTNHSVFFGATWLIRIDKKFNFCLDIRYAHSLLDFNKVKFDKVEFYHNSISPSIGMVYLIE